MKKIVCGALSCFIVLFGIYMIVFHQNTSAECLEDKYDSSIPQVHSSIDADDDGIDDQVDLLNGALDYIKTKPKYKSKYYNTGYPDDHYGVCTDVVANAFRSAGYDLMTLVQEDIANNPKEYDIEEVDPNIDFRRVKNLKVYFAHTATELTTDIHEIEEWQGGDIVIFKKHIGIVSDHRNKNGVPYVIHHNDPKQKSYEEDILEKRNDIVGHYRILTSDENEKWSATYANAEDNNMSMVFEKNGKSYLKQTFRYKKEESRLYLSYADLFEDNQAYTISRKENVYEIIMADAELFGANASETMMKWTFSDGIDGLQGQNTTFTGEYQDFDNSNVSIIFEDDGKCTFVTENKYQICGEQLTIGQTTYKYKLDEKKEKLILTNDNFSTEWCYRK